MSHKGHPSRDTKILDFEVQGQLFLHSESRSKSKLIISEPFLT